MEIEYIAETVLPSLPEYAQVGKLWSVERCNLGNTVKCYCHIRNSVHDMVERHKHTLGIIEMLQNKILIGTDGFYQVCV